MVKKTTQKSATTKAKKPVKKTHSSTPAQSQKVDYYPNRVALLVSATAAITLLALAFIVYL